MLSFCMIQMNFSSNFITLWWVSSLVHLTLTSKMQKKILRNPKIKLFDTQSSIQQCGQMKMAIVFWTKLRYDSTISVLCVCVCLCVEFFIHRSANETEKRHTRNGSWIMKRKGNKKERREDEEKITRILWINLHKAAIQRFSNDKRNHQRS